MINQILMAAARGARIQWSGPHPEEGEWFPAKNIWFDTVDTHRRIHPDDEALRFGPISTALREAAVKPPVYAGFLGYPVWGHVCNDMRDSSPHPKRNGRMYYEHAEELHRSLFLLVLSEALAQEGL